MLALFCAILLLMISSKASFAQISEEGAQFTVNQNSDAVDANLAMASAMQTVQRLAISARCVLRSWKVMKFRATI